MIEIKNVQMEYPIPKRYLEYVMNPLKKKSHIALHKVNLEIKTGDKVAFLGTNGAGKTTLLKLIGGLLYPTKGKITVNCYDSIKNNLKARKSVGFVLNEERSFYWRLTGQQNLEFFGTLDNLYGKDLKNKIDNLIQLVGLNDSRNNLFAGYSSGMKQRLAIARGLISDPNILILDEPTRTLDPMAAEDITNLILQKIYKESEKTLLIATHRLDEAEILCDKICLMKQGEIKLFNDLDYVKNKYGSLFNCYKELMG